MVAKAGRLALAAACGMTALAAAASNGQFEVVGRVEPPQQASVSLHGVRSPFAVSTLSDSHGSFRFTHLPAAQYTLAVFVPGYGERHLSIDVGRGSTDKRGRFEITVRLDRDVPADTLGGKVSTTELAISDRARNEYFEAQKRLQKPDIEGAIEHLRRAVELAPGFTEAWNHLGTIAYQAGRYKDAEGYFRKALTADPTAFAPLVNLGGVLLALEKNDEACQYNLSAVRKRPEDALANSQLGMNYLVLNQTELAEKYLLEARRLDPGHFSHPQLLLAEIYLRRDDRQKAADQLEEFLHYHPDWPSAARIREGIAKLRNR